MKDDLSDFADLDRLEQRGRSTAQTVYIVQAIAWFIPLLWFVAAIIIFLKRDQYRDNWLDDHFRWQWRTVWFGALWGGINILLIIFPPLMWLSAVALMIWLAYRVIKGWLRLGEGQELY
ncbi:MAG: DUF4870 family protein [Granulosicoccaceae bacterium]